MAAKSPSPSCTGLDYHQDLLSSATNSSSSTSSSPLPPSTPLTLDLPSLTTTATSTGAAFRNPLVGASSRTNSSNSTSTSASASTSSSNSSLLGDDWLAAGMVTPQQPGSPLLSPTSRVRARRNSNLDNLDLDSLDQDNSELDYAYRTPPPRPPFSHPPSPPKPGAGQYSPLRDPSQLKQYATYLASNPLWVFHSAQLSGTGISQNQQQYASFSTPYDEQMQQQPRKPLTSIAGSSRCLWPPNSTFLTMSSQTSQTKEKAYQQQVQLPHRSLESSSSHLHQGKNSESGAISASSAALAVHTTANTHKNHSRSDSFKDAGDSTHDLQPRRKARRMMDGPYFKERNHLMVASHVQKLIQEAVEDGVGELDLSNLELNDLPSDIRDLNYAIIYSERGSFSLSKNRLKLFLSSNQFSTVPMDVFSLQNLSVLSLRNNNIEVIPPEIGQLHNLVELSLGGNLLKYLPSQIVLLPKLHILTIHPNPFLKPPPPEITAVEAGVGLPTPGVAPAAAVTPEHVVVVNSLPSFVVGHTITTNSIVTTTATTAATTPTALFSTSHLHQQSSLGMSTSRSSLLSPPASPPAFEFHNDVEMELELLQEMGPPTTAITEGSSASNPDAGSSTDRDNTMETEEDVDLTLSSDVSTDDTTLTEEALWTFPPHEVTRSRFPSLLVLAGYTVLNHMEQQQEQQKLKKRSSVTDPMEQQLRAQGRDSSIVFDAFPLQHDYPSARESTLCRMPKTILKAL
ncbi:hypothetical protein BGZ83_000475 [Gryganskiella cystojenkinii]|nr:hypothetical protein BGZ83_000475 [Gryganskiella cystojenkinii]